MYCSNCGATIDNNAVVCVHCGCQTQNNKPAAQNDNGSIWWGVLGFFIPLAGLIIWATGRDSTPNNAKKAGIGAIVGFASNIILSILWVVIYFVFIVALAGTGAMM